MASEQYGFVFAVSFIIIFTAIISTMPIDLQGEEATPDIVSPINPSLLSDFSEAENYTSSAFTLGIYAYDLGDYSWLAGHSAAPAFSVGAKETFFGLWFGGMSYCDFVSQGGTDRGISLSLDEIETDAEEGTVRYNLIFEDNGNSGGGFVVYWNTTTYTDSSDAWDNDELYLLHGIGFTASTNIASLLLSLLFLQVPSIPYLLNVILVSPLWASIIYVVWFIIKSMIPLLG